MTTAAELAIVLKMKDDLTAGLRHVKSELASVAQSIKHLNAESQQAGGIGGGGFVKNLLATAGGFAVAQAGIAAVTAGFRAGTGALFGFNDSIDKTRIGFTTMLGSAEQADTLIRQLVDFARSTPFEFAGLAQTSQKLVSVGFAASDVIPIMTAVGDAVSAAGRGAPEVDRVVLALTQMAAKGKISLEELNQLSEAGVQGIPLLAAGFNKSTAEIIKMIEQGLIPADQAIKVLVDGMARTAPGAMDKMSRTWGGAVSNIKDSLSQLIGTGFRPLFDLLVDGANKLAAFLQTPQVMAFARVASEGIREIISGLRALFSGDWAKAGDIFGDIARNIAAGLLQVASLVAGQIPRLVSTLADLAGHAAGWGFNLIASFAQGMAEAASAAITAVLQSIGDLIAGFLEGFSPPKKGKLTKIDVWGTNVLNAYLQGMTKADFSILDGVGKAIEDLLAIQVQQGDLPKEGLIPALIGSQAMVAQALADVREFGVVSEATFGSLRDLLGDASGAVLALLGDFLELATTERELASVNAEIGRLEQAIADVDAAWVRAKRPIEDQITLINELFDTEKRRIDQSISDLERRNAIIRRQYQPELNALDRRGAGERLAADEEALGEARSAPAERARRAQEEADNAQRGVAAAERRLRDAQQRLADERAKGSKADPSRIRDAQEGVGDAQLALSQAQTRAEEARTAAAKAGVETAQDRLRITQSERAVIEDRARIETIANEQEIDSLQDQNAELERQRNEQLSPLEQQLRDVNTQHEMAVRMLNDQLEPLQKNRAELEKQQAAQQAVVQLALDRIGHERGVSDQLQQQLDLLNQMASAGGAGGGGAGGAGGIKAPAMGALAGMFGGTGGKGLLGDFESRIDEEVKKLKEKLQTSIEAEFSELKRNLKESIKRVFEDMFSDIDWSSVVPVGLGAILGGVIGGVLTGGNPIGIAVGAAVGGSIGHALAGINWREVVQPVEGAISAIGGFFEGLGGVVGPIVSEVMAFAVKEFGVIRTWWETDGEEIKAAAGRVFDGIATLLHGMEVAIGIILVTLRTAWDTWGDDLKASAERVWNGIKGIIDGVIQGITATLTALAKFINGDFSDAWTTFSGRGGALDNFGEAFLHLTGIILEPFRLMLETIATTIKTTLSLALGAMGTDFDTLKGKLQPVKDILDWLVNLAKNPPSIRINISWPDPPGWLDPRNLDPRNRKSTAASGSGSGSTGSVSEASQALSQFTSEVKDAREWLGYYSAAEADAIFARAKADRSVADYLRNTFGITLADTNQTMQMINITGGALGQSLAEAAKEADDYAAAVRDMQARNLEAAMPGYAASQGGGATADQIARLDPGRSRSTSVQCRHAYDVVVVDGSPTFCCELTAIFGPCLSTAPAGTGAGGGYGAGFVGGFGGYGGGSGGGGGGGYGAASTPSQIVIPVSIGGEHVQTIVVDGLQRSIQSSLP